MATAKVADKIVEILHQSGVKRIYGLIGDSLNPIGDAVRRHNNIGWVAVRNEETAALGADAEALLTEELCVCAATAGPGSVHLINGLYDANRNNAPVLVIVTDTDSSQNGLDYFQATTPVRLYQDCSIFCERLMTASQMPRLLQEAMEVALNQKGVAIIIISKDISNTEIAASPYQRAVVKIPAQLTPTMESISHLADLLNLYNKITLYCGYGCLHAKNEVLSLASALKSPIIHTLRSKYFIEAENPYNVGINGYLATGEAKYALENCELLLLLGCDFPYNNFIPTTPVTVQIDINAKHFGRRSRLDFGVAGDVKTTLELLQPLLKHKNDYAFLNHSLDFSRANVKKRLERVIPMKNDRLLNPEYLTKVISEMAPDKSIFTIDVGLNDIWAARYLESRPHRIITGSFKHGTMAAAMPMAIGAKFAYPERPVIALAGDGGIAMLLGDLLTIVQHNLDIKIVVYNNGELGFINKEAHMENIPPFETSLKNPNFADLAEVMGIKGFRVENPAHLPEIIETALNYKGAVLIDCVTNPEALGNIPGED